MGRLVLAVAVWGLRGPAFPGDQGEKRVLEGVGLITPAMCPRLPLGVPPVLGTPPPPSFTFIAREAIISAASLITWALWREPEDPAIDSKLPSL